MLADWCDENGVSGSDELRDVARIGVMLPNGDEAYCGSGSGYGDGSGYGYGSGSGSGYGYGY